MGKRTQSLALVVLAAGIAVGAILVYSSDTKNAKTNLPLARERSCLNNLRQMGVAFKSWALDNEGQFPWGVSTNQGGTKELSAAATDGVDANPAPHFQVLSNELLTPLLLVCPRDKSRRPAKDFESLVATNITYQLHTLPTTGSSGPKRIIAVCPIDGNTLWSDGAVEGEKETPADDGLGHPMHAPGSQR